MDVSHQKWVGGGAASALDKHSPGMAITHVLESEHVNIKKAQQCPGEKGQPAFPPRFISPSGRAVAMAEAVGAVITAGARSHGCLHHRLAGLGHHLDPFTRSLTSIVWWLPFCSTQGDCDWVTHPCSSAGRARALCGRGPRTQLTLPLPCWALGHVCQREDTHQEKPSQGWGPLYARYQQGDFEAHLSWAAPWAHLS